MNDYFRAFMARLWAVEAAPPWTVATGLGLLVVYVVARIIIAPLLVTAVLAPDPAISPLVTNVTGIVAGILALGVVWMTIQRRVGGPPTHVLRLDKTTDPIWFVVLFSLGAAIAVDLVPLAFQTRFLPVNLEGLGTEPITVWILAALFTVVVGPLAEAVLLSGVLYPTLAVRAGNRGGILLTALAFTVVQVIVQATDNPLDLVLWLESLLTGVYVTGVRAHQQSTRAAAIAGIMFGAFAMFKAMRLFF